MTTEKQLADYITKNH